MRIVTLTVIPEPLDFPIASPDGGKWRIGITGPTTESQDVDAPNATFTAIAGDYTGTGQRLDTTGTPIGPVASAAFNVVDLMKAVAIAKSIEVTLV